MRVSTTTIVSAALFLCAARMLVNGLLNFDQLQRLAERNDSSRTVAAQPQYPAPPIKVSAVPLPPTVWLAQLARYRRTWVDDHVLQALMAAWLDPLNRYRVLVGLAPVVADAQLSSGDFLHAQYLAMNYGADERALLRLGADAHSEDPAKPDYTAEGAAAAQASDVALQWEPHGRLKPSWAIDMWMTGPFHRVPIINPALSSVGYGFYCQGGACVAALNIKTDIDPPSPYPVTWPRPLMYPPDGAVIASAMFSGEWPDPLAACPGYTTPVGLPITLELGRSMAPRVTAYAVKGPGANRPAIEACAFDANTYVNSDPMAQSTGRATLRQFGTIVIVPRRPLFPGRYVVEVSAGKRYTWSFSIKPPPGR
jgi:uncharacterized protein YkwD